MDDLNAGALRYLRFVLSELKVSPSKLAKDAGISPTTLTRFLNSSDYKYTISTTTIEKITKASGINPAPFFASKSVADIGLATYFKSSSVYDESWGNGDDNTTTKTTIVIGEVAAGQWREMELLDIMKMPPLAVDLSFYESSQCFAMVVRGESINRVARDGDFLLCIRRDAMRWDFKPGDLAIVQRIRDGGRMIEMTAKRVKRRDAAWELWPDSDDERFQKPVSVESMDDSQEITFVGLVEFIVRQP